MMIPNLKSKFLNAYLQYTMETEPPKIMHIWSALSAVSACAGRHCWLQTGLGKTYLNTYILLVGPPAVRKSTAINFGKTLLEENTDVRLAPKDTSGQRQGLIAAMEDKEDEEFDAQLRMIDLADKATALDQIGNIKISGNEADKHVLHICASEFGSFIGQNNLELTRFLLEIWDGENYDYRLKHSKMVLDEPLLSLIGGTTPTDISKLLPQEAIGGGFTSRIVFVHANEKYKKIPPSKVFLDKTQLPYLRDTVSRLNRQLKGAMFLTDEAAELEDHIYMTKTINLNDTRFVYYAERRHTHMMKTAGLLALADARMVVDVEDIDEADRLLSFTELTMPQALGEFGLSPLSAAKQKLLEFIVHAGEPVPLSLLWILLQNDMSQMDFKNTLHALVSSNKIVSLQGAKGLLYSAKQSVDLDIFAE